MPDLQPLNIIVAAADKARFYSALETAMAAAALGSRVRIFLQGEAAALARAPVAFAGDADRRAAGLADLAAMITEAAAMDIHLLICQSGMALVGMTADELVPHARSAGLVSYLGEVGSGDRLIIY